MVSASSPSQSSLRDASSPKVGAFGSPRKVPGFAKGSPFGRAGASAPERARMLTENFEHCDNTALLKSLLVAVQRLRHTGFALSVIASDATSPKGRG